MGRTACTEPQWLYKGTLYPIFYYYYYGVRHLFLYVVFQLNSKSTYFLTYVYVNFFLIMR